MPAAARYVTDYAELTGQDVEDVLVMILDQAVLERIVGLMEHGMDVSDYVR